MKISVVIVTFNSASTLRPCLDSVLNQSGADKEVWVVDNGSQDATVDILRSYGASVLVIRNRFNAGPARARNQGIRAGRGEWVLTLDSDAWLSLDFLENFVRAAKSPSDARLGMAAPTILRPDGRTIYSLGHRLTWLRRFYEEGQGRPLGTFRARFDRVLGPCSAAAFYRRAMLADVAEGGAYFDERFFFMAEDVDLSWRARRRGWRMAGMPASICFHKGGGAGLPEARKDYFSIRNRFLMMAKNDPWWRSFLLGLPLGAYETVRWVHRSLRGRGADYAAACRDARRIMSGKSERGRQ